MPHSLVEISEQLRLIHVWDADFIRMQADGARAVHGVEIDAYEARRSYGRELARKLDTGLRHSDRAKQVGSATSIIETLMIFSKGLIEHWVSSPLPLRRVTIPSRHPVQRGNPVSLMYLLYLT